MSREPLTVVVPTRNRPDRLDRCLAALVPHLDAGDEVVVVDSAGTTPATAQVAAAHGARFARADRPGASLARNLGWLAARHPLVGFLDDDVVPDPRWRDAVAIACADPAVAFVTGRAVPVDPAGPALSVTLHADARPLVPTDPHAGGAGNAAVRRDALAAVGGFDERLGPATWFAAAEDLDLFDRLLAAGYAGRYDPALLVHHDQPAGGAARVRTMWCYGKGSGARLAKVARRDRRLAATLALAVLPDPRRRRRLQTRQAGQHHPEAATVTPAGLGLVRAVGTVVAFAVASARLRGDQPAPGARG